MNLNHIITEAVKGNHIAIICKTRVHAMEDYINYITDTLSRYNYKFTYNRNTLSIDIPPGKITCFIGSRGPSQVRGLQFDTFYFDGDCDPITQETMEVIRYNTGRRNAPKNKDS